MWNFNYQWKCWKGNSKENKNKRKGSAKKYEREETSNKDYSNIKQRKQKLAWYTEISSQMACGLIKECNLCNGHNVTNAWGKFALTSVIKEIVGLKVNISVIQFVWTCNYIYIYIGVCSQIWKYFGCLYFYI